MIPARGPQTKKILVLRILSRKQRLKHVPNVDRYVYAHASNGLRVHYHGILAANFRKKTARRRWRCKETDSHDESCYRADAGDTNGHELNDAESTKWSTNAGQQLCC